MGYGTPVNLEQAKKAAAAAIEVALAKGFGRDLGDFPHVKPL